MKKFLTIALIANFILLNDIGTSMADNIKLDKNLNELINEGYKVKLLSANNNYVVVVLQKKSIKVESAKVKDMVIPRNSVFTTSVLCKTNINDLSKTECVLP